MWFWDSGASRVFYAQRATGWMYERGDFNIGDAGFVGPGMPAFHDGTVRMVVEIGDLGSTQTRVAELSSPNGRSWTELDTIQFAPANASASETDRDHSLSPDGCVLVFYRSSSRGYELYYVGRDPNGSFVGPPKRIEALVGTTTPHSPSIASDGALWFVDRRNSLRVVRGAP